MPLPAGHLARQLDSAPLFSSERAWLELAPGWVRRLSETASGPTMRDAGAAPVVLLPSGDLSIAVGGVRGIRGASDRELEIAAATLYSSVLSTLERAGRHPWRFWNFIPGLLDPVRDGLNRYMVFNAGRVAGYRRAFPPEALPEAIATATGVGTSGDDLLVGCLAGAAPGAAVENPRQVPAHRYSPKFGPSAPFFVRATLVGTQLLIGGTAAVVGEESIAPGDLEGQVDETVRNLDALIASAAARSGLSVPGTMLDRLTTLRAYLVDGRESARVGAQLESRGIACPVEFVQAELCRPELLVEIEGTADLALS